MKVIPATRTPVYTDISSDGSLVNVRCKISLPRDRSRDLEKHLMQPHGIENVTYDVSNLDMAGRQVALTGFSSF